MRCSDSHHCLWFWASLPLPLTTDNPNVSEAILFGPYVWLGYTGPHLIKPCPQCGSSGTGIANNENDTVRHERQLIFKSANMPVHAHDWCDRWPLDRRCHLSRTWAYFWRGRVGSSRIHEGSLKWLNYSPSETWAAHWNFPKIIHYAQNRILQPFYSGLHNSDSDLPSRCTWTKQSTRDWILNHWIYRQRHYSNVSW